MHDYTSLDSQLKISRTNADPLIGLPSIMQQNYNAAGNLEVQLQTLRFEKARNYYNMFVKSFILDKIAEVGHASQSGDIPEEWVAMGSWQDRNRAPPEGFWRTLVADRGREGRNAPLYCPRAFKKHFRRQRNRHTQNHEEMMNDISCSVISNFLARVQSVIWNRV
jgi:hypothetical protein